MPEAPEPTLTVHEDESLLSAISREIVTAMKQYYGRGPSRAKSYLIDDLLFVVMRGGITVAEETMLEAGEADTVRAFRQRFENVMAKRLVGTIEQLTERVVVNYQSQVLFDPDVLIEMFVFDKPVKREALEETARAVLQPAEPIDEVSRDEDSLTGVDADTP
jgi:uncharacterized protein YbcI